MITRLPRSGLLLSLLALGSLLLAPCPSPAGPVPTSKPSHYPDWWFERDVIPRLPAHANNPSPVWPDHYPVADDFAAANIGQLKQIASRAAAEFDAQLPLPGAGANIHLLINAWAVAPAHGIARDDFAALNQGQMKAVVELFYQRLAAYTYTGQPLSSGQIYPWTPSTADDDTYAAVNLGQLKNAFSFTAFLVNLVPDDGDGDGLPDNWEITHFGTTSAQTGASNADSDSLSNRAEYLLGTNPQTVAQQTALGVIVYSP